MQKDEEYGNMVWDKHFGELFNTMKNQKSTSQKLSVINPFSSLQSLSMAICGSDYLHHLHFQQEAEKYRRHMVKLLNDKHAFGGSLTGDWGWNADEDFYRSIENFNYKTPAFSPFLKQYATDIFTLLLWLFLCILFAGFVSRSMNVM